MSLGNEKPKCLSCMEKALWKTLLRIASGSAITTELSSFYATYSTISASFQGRRGESWFEGGEYLFFSTWSHC
jgi:hypothetical protein